MELKFKVRFKNDKDFELTDSFLNLLNDGAVREELEWEVSNVVNGWMFPNTNRKLADVKLDTDNVRK